jgi:hypothetical protein
MILQPGFFFFGVRKNNLGTNQTGIGQWLGPGYVVSSKDRHLGEA